MDFDLDAPLHAQPFYLIPDDARVVLHARAASLRVPAPVAAAIVEHLLPLMNGERSGTEIVALAAGRLPAERGAALLRLLVEHGLAVAGERRPPLNDTLRRRVEPLRRHFAGRAHSGWAAVAALRAARVAVVDLGAIAPALLSNLVHAGIGRVRYVTDGEVQETDLPGSALLHEEDAGRPWREVLDRRLPASKFETGVDVVARIPGDVAGWSELLRAVDVAVVALGGPTYAHPVLQQLNVAALETGTRWTLAAHVQHAGGPTVGPTVIPGSTACHACFEQQLAAGQGESRLPGLIGDYLRQGGAQVDLGSFAPLAELAANLATMEVCEMLVSPQACRSAGKLLVFDPEAYSLSLRPVQRSPRCPACGRFGRAATRAWS